MKQKSSFCRKLLTLLSFVFRQLQESCSAGEREIKFEYTSKKRKLKLKIKKIKGGIQNGNNELAQSKV